MIKRKSGKILAIVAGVLAIVTAIGLFASLFSFGASHKSTGGGSESIGSPPTTVAPVYGQRASDYALLYAQEGLVACYMGYSNEGLTAYVDPKTEVMNYTWKNYVEGGEDAIITHAGYWRMTNGGLGYAFRVGDETVPVGVGCEFPQDLSPVKMPTFEFECVATFLGKLSGDGFNRAYYTGTQGAGIHSGDNAKSPFRVGLVHSMSYMTLHESLNFNYCNRWYLGNLAYNSHFESNSEHTQRLTWDYKLGAFNESAHDLHPLRWSVRQVSSPIGVGYNIGYDYKGDSWYSYVSDCFYSERIAELDSYKSSDMGFSIFNDYGGIIYGVRLYNRTLTDAEKTRNTFVDLCAFYDVNVSSFFTKDAEELEAFLTRCGTAADYNDLFIAPTDPMTGDDTEYQEQRVKLYEIINDNWEA